ncbi:phage GP46 family protein [Sodalis sp. RH24]|uniref:phage GP46 family protein n=1 Tax=unclassified Sodalis (in: enterobacteria) TaxID=2636512 RepID=UPI0039B5250E
MILTVNGVQQAVTAPLDQLTRAVVISLFTWRRALPDDVVEEPVGWWGDSYPTVQNDRIGSRLYLLRRAKLTNQTAILAKGYVIEALQWMTDDGAAARVDVVTERQGLDRLAVGIAIFKSDGTRHNLNFDDIWSALNG